ncbi:MAG: replicative DNA helicase [Bacillaceae bacterium G1]|nr:replicative DNA helicase [Bacillota bacterium]OJF17863.1 MAG: replicative DNA helicase [Bacillaceae bacterium G1]
MSDLFLDRLPPQNIEAEQSVIGAILIDPDVLFTVMETLRPEDFYRPAHQKIYKAMCRLLEEGQPVDLVTVTAALRDDGVLEEVGGISYLSELATSVPTSANVQTYAQIVEEKAMLRRLIAAAAQIASAGYAGGEDAQAIIDEAERRILEISQRRHGSGFLNIKDVLMETYERIEMLYTNKGGVTGLPTGYPDLDRMTSGLQNSDLIIVAARPSVGKTAFALNIAQNVALHTQVPVAIFSLEMPAIQLVQRMLSAEGNIDSHRLRSGYLEPADWEKLTLAMASLSEAPIFIDDTPHVTVFDIRAKCRRLKAEHGLGLVIIDYLQLISGRGGDNRQQEISEISRGLKGLARELDVPVIALSQLSRAVEQRQDKRPMLSDIRESGSIEQDADVVAFLYRDDYYHPDTDRPNVVEVIIGKQRNGPTGTVELLYLKNYNKFVSLAKYAEEPAGA